MAVASRLSIEEFEKLTPPDGVRYELVCGEVVELTFPTPKHNLIAAHVWRLLADFAEPRGLGLVFPADTGFVLSREASTLRGPDVAFLSAERAQSASLDSNIEGAPDLAVEVVSPTDTVRELRRKVEQYLEGGSREVWVLPPKAREAQVFRPGERPRTLLAEDAIESPSLLPGFSVRVADLLPSAF